MKKLPFLIIIVISLSACQVTQPTVSYDAFDDVTKISLPEACVFSPGGLSSLCLKIVVQYLGNYSYENLLAMDEYTRNSLVADRFLTWTYKAESWLFVESIVVKVDNQKYRISSELSNREVRHGKITEWGKQRIVEGTEMYKFFQKLSNSEFEGKKIQMRVYGESYYVDF